jgi:putative addiction module component (TIGR02574 family)
MNLTAEELAERALALPIEARARLADLIVESLSPPAEEAIEKLWASEAVSRLNEVRSGCVQTVPGDEALARVRKAVGR